MAHPADRRYAVHHRPVGLSTVQSGHHLRLHLARQSVPLSADRPADAADLHLLARQRQGAALSKRRTATRLDRAGAGLRCGSVLAGAGHWAVSGVQRRNHHLRGLGIRRARLGHLDLLPAVAAGVGGSAPRRRHCHFHHRPHPVPLPALRRSAAGGAGRANRAAGRYRHLPHHERGKPAGHSNARLRQSGDRVFDLWRGAAIYRRRPVFSQPGLCPA